MVEVGEMSDFYALTDNSLFTVFSIAKFVRTSHFRINATADADIMRASLTEIGMREYGTRRWKDSREISKQAAIDHIAALATSATLANCSILTLVISSHGRFTHTG